jgi:hypothetical protein
VPDFSGVRGRYDEDPYSLEINALIERGLKTVSGKRRDYLGA